MNVHGPEDTSCPDCPWSVSSASLTLPRAQHPMSAPWSHQSLPQCCHSRAGFQLSTALPGHGPCWAGPTCGPTSCPGLGPSLSPGRCPMPVAGAAPVPLAALIMAGAVRWALAAGFCNHSPREPPTLPVPAPLLPWQMKKQASMISISQSSKQNTTAKYVGKL